MNNLIASFFFVFITFSSSLFATELPSIRSNAFNRVRNAFTGWYTEVKNETKVDLKTQYEEVMRRLPPSERTAVENRVSSVTEPELELLVAAMSKHAWRDTVFDDDGTYTYLALAALKKGMITKHQFGTIMLYFVNFSGARVQSGEAIPLFGADSSVNPKARILISKTFRGRLQKFNLTELFQEMKKYPESEQRFFILKKPRNSDFSIIDSIEGARLYFLRDTNDGNIMVPSFGLMQAFLDVRFKDQAVRINPVLGLSSEEDIRNNGLDGVRDIALHFPQTTLPSEADGLPASAYDFTYHDFYHALVASNAPIEHRRAFIRIGDTLKKSPLPYAQALGASLMDMEAAGYKMIEEGYSAKDGDSSNLSFWMACLGFHILVAQPDEKRAYRFEELPPPDALAKNAFKLLLSDEEKEVVRGMTKLYPVTDETRSAMTEMFSEPINDDPIFTLMRNRAFLPTLLEE